MKQYLLIFTFLLLSSLAPRPGLCWDKYGHMVIAQIAYDRLTPVAKQKVDSLLAVMQNDPHVTELDNGFKPYNAVTIAAWMDDMRSKTKEFNPWHYVDLPDTGVTHDTIVSDFGKDSEPNVYEAIVNKCEKALNDDQSTQADKARMLGFLYHLEGDIHQPLHCMGRQQGGNQYKITPLQSADPSWKVDNIHAFWDNAYRYDSVGGKIALQIDTRDMPRSMQPDDSEIKKIADLITKSYLTGDKTKLADLDPADWAMESYTIAFTFVFPPSSPQTLSPEYVHQAHDIACSRMALAGHRLANLLNKTLDP